MDTYVCVCVCVGGYRSNFTYGKREYVCTRKYMNVLGSRGWNVSGQESIGKLPLPHCMQLGLDCSLSVSSCPLVTRMHIHKFEFFH